MAGEGHEIERQYVLAGPEPSLPETLGGFRLEGREERRIRDEYLDTPSRELRAAGAVLRLRRQGGRTLATYKSRGERDADGTRRREEIEAPLAGERERHPAFYAARRHGEGPLEVVGVLRNDRTAYRYGRDGEAVEVVLDRLTYPDGSRELRVEVEGEAQAVARVGTALEDAFPGLAPAETSKAAELARRLGGAAPLDAAALRRRSRRTLHLHGEAPQQPRRMLQRLLEEATDELEPDRYGGGRLVAAWEREVAELLGHEAAVFLPTGTMAQQIALRIHADRRGRRAVAFHPRCHLERHERGAYRALHGLDGIPLGDPDRLLALDDLDALRLPLAALVLELPQRELGGRLPPFEDVLAQVELAHARGAAAHLDGARIWECAPFYGRSYAELCRPFDTVYVSFYKRLGGLGGCALAGPGELVAEAREWQLRHGGRVFALYPYVLAARAGLRERLPRMARYQEHACALAEALRGLPGLEVVPDPPQAAMMHVLVRGAPEPLVAAALEVAAERDVFLFEELRPTTSPSWQRFELSVGDATLEVAPAEARELLAEVLRRAENVTRGA